MFCAKCGSELPDDSKICSVCGEKLMEKIPEMQNKPEKSNALSSVFSGGNTKLDPIQYWNKVGIKKIIYIAIVVLVVVVAIFGLKGLFSRIGSDNIYVCLSDGKYALITDISKGAVVEIASSRSDATGNMLLSFSPDGKYVYYYTKYDPSSRTGTLCRAEYGKLKKDSGKNEKYIEIIATNVRLGFHFMDNGSLIYENGDGTLYYYENQKTSLIAKDIYDNYATDGSGRIVYVTGDDSVGKTLYGVVLSDMDNRIKLASNFAAIQNVVDFDNILYTKYEDDGSETLYMVGFKKEAEKMAEKVIVLPPVGDKTYFTTENGKTLNLYNFVEDTCAESDMGIVEPKVDDYSIPKYIYEKVYGAFLSESDFDELYTTCTKGLYWYGGIYSMKDAVDKNWGKNTVGICTATQNFIDKFADTADENGYILVTDEVKAALQEIQKCSYTPENQWEWMWLCYNKYQSGMTTDYDAYNIASEEWREAINRNKLREILQNKENDYAVHTLYCFDKGSLTVINENVLDAKVYQEVVIFNTVDNIKKTVPLENVTSVYDVYSLFGVNNETENYIVFEDGISCQMSASAAETFAKTYDNYATLYFTNEGVFLNGSDGILFVAAVKDGIVSDFTIVADDAKILDVDKSVLYYANGFYRTGDKSYCDLYSYSNGTSTCLAKDVIFDKINIYDDGIILAYTDYRSFAGYELSMIGSEGEITLIGEDVTQYIRVDESMLLYISDEDLYYYNGRDKGIVQNEVDWFWSKKSKKIIHSFN